MGGCNRQSFSNKRQDPASTPLTTLNTFTITPHPTLRKLHPRPCRDRVTRSAGLPTLGVPFVPFSCRPSAAGAWQPHTHPPLFSPALFPRPSS